MDLDQQIGSILEAWITRDTDGVCRFCNSHVGDVAPDERFCTDECKDRFEKVLDARIALGKRDLQQRGYD